MFFSNINSQTFSHHINKYLLLSTLCILTVKLYSPFISFCSFKIRSNAYVHMYVAFRIISVFLHLPFSTFHSPVPVQSFRVFMCMNTYMLEFYAFLFIVCIYINSFASFLPFSALCPVFVILIIQCSLSHLTAVTVLAAQLQWKIELISVHSHFTCSFKCASHENGKFLV